MSAPLPRRALPEVELAQQMLRDGRSTIPEIVEATGIRSDVIGCYWQHMARGEVFDREQGRWVKPATTVSLRGLADKMDQELADPR